MSKTYYIYLLTNHRCSVLYTGVTKDLQRRMYQHKHKMIDGFSKKYSLDRLVYYEAYTDILDAISREKEIKGWLRHKKDDLVKMQNPAWDDLCPTLFPSMSF